MSLTLALAAVMMIAACSATKTGDIEEIKFSGFLGDYSQLKTGGEDQAAYAWIQPGLNLSSYRRIMIDPPQAWISSEERAEIGEEDMSYLLTSLDKALREDLGEKWVIVDRPGADVIRLRSAISNAQSASGGLSPFTRILPWGRILSLGVRGVTGDYLNQGDITVEAEFLDGGTGNRLAAAVDCRVGRNSPLNTFTNWGDVVDACSWWSERIAERLVEFGMAPSK
ncbi:MAG: DUF3313 domain-containing protein [Planctomycetes bacterium]|nr:DUF3313 domain-containing protein [Planctomycetota bacterium]